MSKNVVVPALGAAVMLLGMLGALLVLEPEPGPRPPSVDANPFRPPSTLPVAPSMTVTTREPETQAQSAPPPDSTSSPAWAGDPAFARRVDCKPTPTGGLDCGSCVTNADCAEDQACATNWSTRRAECLSSNCALDSDCATGERCIPVTASSEGAGVTRCAPKGERELGQTCSVGKRAAETGCGDGLVCHAGLCRQSCRLGAGDCLEGTSCIPTPDGPACERDDCPGGCPEGKHCARGRCSTGPDCTNGDDVCPSGQVCRMSGVGDAWVSACYVPCETNAQCSSDEKCFRNVCRRVCNPSVAGSCPEGQRCLGRGEDFVCRLNAR